MLNSIFLKPFKASFIALAFLLAIVSCTPTSSRVGIGDSTNANTGNTNNSSYSEPAYPLSGTFIQQSSVQTQGDLSLPLNFSDSFMIRGLALSQYVRKLPNTTKFCIVAKYNYTSGQDRFLIISAKPNSFTDVVAKTTEFFLLAEPNNDTANQNDCLNYNLTNGLFTGASSPSASFSLNQLCTNCSSSVKSSAIHLFFVNGQEVPTISMGALTLSISATLTSGGSSCVEDTSCKARGFDCCLDGVCSKDGAVRASALTAAGFTSAQEDVRVNPSRYVLYPQFYYVCPSSSGSTTAGNNGGITSEQAAYEASVRIMEYTQLYQCLNKVDGEFSYCTVKFPGASASIPGTFSASSLGYNDDINFSALNPNYTGEYANNIVKIVYGGSTLYDLKNPPIVNASFISGTNNDNLTSTQSVNITATLPSNAKDDNLYLTYKVDGSCVKVGTTLAKCIKTFVQGSTDTLSTMWHNSSKTFTLPAYADTSSGASLVVKIGGIVVPEDTTTWSKATGPNRIIFSASYPLYQNQQVEITYFVTSNVSSLFGLRGAAQAAVNTMCVCGTNDKCNLTPQLNSSGSLVNYECVYPTAVATTPPANQTVYVSNKNVPHRYYDVNGVSYDESTSGAPAQEMTAFSYLNNDVLKPSNVSTFTGFNEIYGSFATTGSFVAKPAKLVSVKKNQLYNIYTNSGSFSGCTTCGTDYYSSLQKIFPQNIKGMGGGYTPDAYSSTRINSTSLYRSDDLLFGRACFVPATMIPWTHTTGATAQAQRQMRLSGQHFLFANGYSRDWYGFDYGSLIGSFDGVTWFSIGNQRQIKAATSKLFLAVNAYYGDVSVDTNFSVSVSEAVGNTTVPTLDSATDGAECQKSHYCSNDKDCFSQLGYDYTCQNISGLLTSVPQFDANGAETVGSITKTLASIVGGTSGQAKRCVYRGRGAPCLNNLASASGTTFNGSSILGTLTCSFNNACVPLTSGAKFNDRISRFANTPLAQNSAAAASVDSDLVGLGARILGRPFDFYGTKTAPVAATTSLSSNNVLSVCIPGKDVASSTSLFDLNSRTPSTRTDSSDKIMGAGPTMSGLQNANYMNACPAVDASGLSMQNYDLALNDPVLTQYSISQNLSSNLLDLSPLTALGIFSSTAGSKISAIGYQRNMCLRAPGASCFSDFECAPSKTIATKVKSSDLSTLLNAAEVKYWGEELICGNPAFKYTAPGVLNPTFDPKKNVCCRDIGNTMTVFTQTDNTNHRWCDVDTVRVAGVNSPVNSFNRYSRVNTTFDKVTCDVAQVSTTKSYALSLVATDFSSRWNKIQSQFKTLDTVNQRTCCTQNWVRSFASENGGGHAFAKSKTQTLDKGVFKNITWNQQTTNIVTDNAFECDPDNYANASCEIRSITPAEEDKYLTWAGSLELIGIPQVAVKTDDEIHQLVDDNQNTQATNLPMASIKVGDASQTFVTTPVTDLLADFKDGSLNRYYSAASYSKFDMTGGGLKKIFSESEFNCCIPSNQEVPSTTSASQCCTGNLANVNGPLRCCLPDFTDVTVYLNRYVSSEGRGLSDSAYDSATGYIKDAAQVKLMVAQKNLCCSGTSMTGVAIHKLPIPLLNGGYKPADQLSTVRRFNYRTDAVDNNAETGSVGSIYDAGVKWNNHVYCVPPGFGQ